MTTGFTPGDEPVSASVVIDDEDIVIEALEYLIDMYRSNAGWTAAMSRKPLSALPEAIRTLVAKAARAEAELRHVTAHYPKERPSRLL